MEIRDIVKDWLEENGYTGLFHDSGECACKIDDLMPCDGPCLECEAGYVVSATDDEGEPGFRVSRTKPEQITEGGE